MTFDNKKLFKILCIVLFLPVIIVGLIFIVGMVLIFFEEPRFPSPQDRLFYNYDVILPKNIDVKYNIYESTFTGVAAQYSVINILDDDNEFLSSYNFIYGKNKAIEDRVFSNTSLIDDFISDYLPVFDNKEYCYYIIDELDLIYFYNEKIMIVNINGR